MMLRFLNQSLLLLICVVSIAAASCSIPVLENPECSVARDLVKRFYSFHFGNDMKPTADALESKRDFLTPELYGQLKDAPDLAFDYFTATDDYPKAFRVGECEVVDANRVKFQVLLFWRDATRSEERPINVEMVRHGDKWLINRVWK